MKKLNLRQNFPTFQLLPLKNLVKGATIYKNPEKPSCIDLILTKRPRSFHECHITETSHCDEDYFKKQGPSVIHYRNAKRFNTQSFRQDLFANLHEESVNINQLS